MINTISQINDSFSNTVILPGELISLTQKDYERAIQISESVDSAHQWQAYLNQLAIAAISQWFQEWIGDLTIASSSVSLDSSHLELGLENVCLLQVGEFQCCLLVSESFVDGTVVIPKKLLGISHLATHLYIVMEVWEMEQRASIRGFLRHVEFQRALEQASLAGEPLQIPLALFESSSLSLLSDLQLRSVNAFGLSKSPPVKQPKISPIVNVALWLQDTLDEISHGLGWGLPAPLTPIYAAGWRSTEPFDAAITILMDQGMTIPPHARGSCQSIMLQDIPIHVLAAVWSLPSSCAFSTNDLVSNNSTKNRNEWSLLVMLGMEPGGFLPLGITLQVCDKTQILSEQILKQDESYLIAQVIGDLDDQFDVTITLGSQQQQLNSFIYIPN